MNRPPKPQSTNPGSSTSPLPSFAWGRSEPAKRRSGRGQRYRSQAVRSAVPLPQCRLNGSTATSPSCAGRGDTLAPAGARLKATLSLAAAFFLCTSLLANPKPQGASPGSPATNTTQTNNPASRTGASALRLSERGITATYSFQYEGPLLRAKPQRETNLPLVVRLQRGTAPTHYEARFIGNVSGEFDLRDWLEHADGSPIASDQPLTIQIVSTLPSDPRSDLFEADQFQPGFTGGYRAVVILAALAWLSIPLLVIASRILSKPKKVEAPVAPPPLSLAEQLRPLIESASRGELSTNDKARMELLLVRYWRQEAQLRDADMADAIRQLRNHPQAGPIIVAVEKWLHAEQNDSQPTSAQNVLQLLKPLQSAPANTASTDKSGSMGSQAP